MSEDEAYNEFMSSHPHISSLDPAEHHCLSFRERHAHCSPWSARKWMLPYDPVYADRKKLDLSVLRACRQIYAGANLLLWTTNTFSFEKNSTFQMFVNMIHSTQRMKIRRVHIDYVDDVISAVPNLLGPPLSPSPVFQLSGLRTLHINFTEPIAEYLETGEFKLGLLHMIQALPLQHVTIICDEVFRPPIYYQSPWFSPPRQTIPKRQEVAKRLRSKLLNAKGLKFPATLKEAGEAERGREKELDQAEKTVRE